MKRVFLMLALILFMTASKGQANDPFYEISSKDSCLKTSILEKDIIPCLINVIDTDKKGLVAFVDPTSSYIYPFMLENQIGIKYAYLLELILTKDSLDVDMHWNEDSITLASAVSSFRIYNYGVIVKKDEGGNPILEPLSHKDMVRVKKIYSKWWKQNSEKSINELKYEQKKMEAF